MNQYTQQQRNTEELARMEARADAYEGRMAALADKLTTFAPRSLNYIIALTEIRRLQTRYLRVLARIQVLEAIARNG